MDQHAMRATLRSLFPPGDEDLFAWENPQSWVARELEAITTAVRVHGADAVDRLRAEFRPHTAVEKLPDWERLFGLSESRGARYGSLEGRRSQIVARWREHGASTLDNIQAALAAVLGYVPEVREHGRAFFTARNTAPVPATPVTIAANADTSVVIAVADNAPASRAGARLTVSLTTAAAEDLDVQLEGPDGTTVSWPAPFGSGAVAGAAFVLYAPAFAEKRVDGAWTLTITNRGAQVGALGTGSALLVEGIGRGAAGSEGRAANLFAWTVLVDPAQLASAADVDFARQLVARWNPGHCRGYLAVKATGGSPYAVFSDPNSRFDGAIFG